MSRVALNAFVASLVIMSAGGVCAQDYPTKPIRIVTAAVGGGTDLDSRLIAQGITGPLGQPVVVDNRVALTAAEIVSKAPPDGYTITVQGGSMWLLPLLQSASYDAVKDFAPITLATRSPNILVVNPGVPANSVKELIALAKAKPGALNYASGGNGGTAHLNIELFKHMAGVDIVRVVYKGGSQATAATLSGETQMTVVDTTVMPVVKAGKVKALAITSAEPSALAPGIPTISASGLPGFEATGVSGIWAPAKTSPAIIARLNREIVRFLNTQTAKERMFSQGEDVVANSPEQFATIISNEIAKWSKLIKDAGIKGE